VIKVPRIVLKRAVPDIDDVPRRLLDDDALLGEGGNHGENYRDRDR
jgi:hypothetical protein